MTDKERIDKLERQVNMLYKGSQRKDIRITQLENKLQDLSDTILRLVKVLNM